LQIIDKAAWQIDNGVQPSVVITHFKRLFSWLAAKDMLTAEGKEVFEIGIDDSASLHERLVTPEALAFLLSAYDEYIKNNAYGTDTDSSVLESVYAGYLKGR